MMEHHEIVWKASIGRYLINTANLSMNVFCDKSERISAWCNADMRHRAEKQILRHVPPTLEDFLK